MTQAAMGVLVAKALGKARMQTAYALQQGVPMGALVEPQLPSAKQARIFAATSPLCLMGTSIPSKLSKALAVAE